MMVQPQIPFKTAVESRRAVLVHLPMFWIFFSVLAKHAFGDVTEGDYQTQGQIESFSIYCDWKLKPKYQSFLPETSYVLIMQQWLHKPKPPAESD